MRRIILFIIILTLTFIIGFALLITFGRALEQSFIGEPGFIGTIAGTMLP